MYASIIVPAYNSCERLYYNLLTLNSQDCPGDRFEVIVINNGSRDGTAELLSGFCPNFRLNTVSLDKNIGRAQARNMGIMKSHGDILIFHDSDMLAPRDYVRQHITAHESGSTVVCGMSWRKIFTYFYRGFNSVQRESFARQRPLYRLSGRFSYTKNKYPLISAKQIMDESYKSLSFDEEAEYIDKLMERYGEELRGYCFPWEFFVTNNCSARKQDVLEAGLFDESYRGWGCEDTDLGFRLYERGCSYIVKKDIASIHQEHCINTVDKSMVQQNREMLLKKYDSINILLYFLMRKTSINPYFGSELMKEINMLISSGLYTDLTELFLELLKAVRARVLNIQSEPSTGSDMARVHNRLEEACRSLGLIYFKPAMEALLRDVYNTESQEEIICRS